MELGEWRERWITLVSMTRTGKEATRRKVRLQADRHDEDGKGFTQKEMCLRCAYVEAQLWICNHDMMHSSGVSRAAYLSRGLLGMGDFDMIGGKRML